MFRVKQRTHRHTKKHEYNLSDPKKQKNPKKSKKVCFFFFFSRENALHFYFHTMRRFPFTVFFCLSNAAKKKKKVPTWNHSKPQGSLFAYSEKTTALCKTLLSSFFLPSHAFFFSSRIILTFPPSAISFLFAFSLFSSPIHEISNIARHFEMRSAQYSSVSICYLFLRLF